MGEDSNVSELRRKQAEFERAQKSRELDSLEVHQEKDFSWIFKAIIIFFVIAGLIFLLFFLKLI